jgi:hypothetical protein
MEEEAEEEEEVAKAVGTPTQEASGARAKQSSVSTSVRVPTQRVRGVRMRYPGHHCVLTSRARVSLCSESTTRMMQAALREAECKDWRRRGRSLCRGRSRWTLSWASSLLRAPQPRAQEALCVVCADERKQHAIVSWMHMCVRQACARPLLDAQMAACTPTASSHSALLRRLAATGVDANGE